MADALGAPELALDSRFATNDLRCQNRPELAKAIDAVTRTQTVQHWIDKLNAAGIPCSPINTIDKLFDHPQLKSRDMIIKVKGDGARAVRTAGNPIRMGGYALNDTVNPIAAPGLNQHREKILHEFMAPRDSYQPASADEEPQAEVTQFNPAAKLSAE